MEKPYTFRKLKSTELFLMLNLVKKIGITTFSELFTNKDIQSMFKGGDKTNDEYEAIGKAVLSIAQLIIERLGDCEKEINALLVSCSDLSLEQIKDLDIDVYFGMIVDFIRKDDFMGFFKRAMELLK